MSDAFVTFAGVEERAALSATTSVEVFPATVTLSFATEPPGLELGVGSDLEAAPFSRTVIIGSTQSMSAPSPQVVGARSYAFGLWSDGGAQSHTVVAPGTPVTYTAHYQPLACADGLDNDGDGDVDHPDDPACSDPTGVLEGTLCDDDLDNDGDGTVDWDGGSQGAAPDAGCLGDPRRMREWVRGCGLGFELAFALLPLAIRRRRLPVVVNDPGPDREPPQTTPAALARAARRPLGSVR